MQNSYRLTIKKEYAESLLKDLASVGAIELSLSDHEVSAEEETARRDKNTDESLSADEKFKKFMAETAARNPEIWKEFKGAAQR